MYHLVYTSHAIKPFTDEELFNLLRQSRERNKEFSVSGILLYVQGKFMQVLEGKKSFVEEIYSSIQRDTRHNRVTLLLEGDSPKRIFKGWSMGFKKLSNEDFVNASGFTDIDVFFNENKMKESSSVLLVFLKLFYRKNMVDYPETIPK
jgi:Sensors of blue-light using FAD